MDYNEKLGTLLSSEDTATESERGAGIHLESIMSDWEGKPPDDWNIHWANVHASAAYYISEYTWLKEKIQRLESELKALLHKEEGDIDGL